MIKLSARQPKYVDEFGEHKECISEWEPRFKVSSSCFVITKSWRGKYFVKECRVSSYWFTNIWGYKMTNGWCFTATDENDLIFAPQDLNTAIEMCAKKNRMRKVRVRYL